MRAIPRKGERVLEPASSVTTPRYLGVKVESWETYLGVGNQSRHSNPEAQYGNMKVMPL